MIRLIKSSFYNEKDTKIQLCKFIKKTNRFSIGEETEKFENNFTQYQGRKYCVFVNSGSSANLAILQSLLNMGYLQKGDSVGFSALTWSTDVMPLIELGLIPVPIDCELDTLNVSSRTLKNAIKHHPIKVLLLTNLLGFCDDIDKISSICKHDNIILIEDNCESLGTVYKAKKLGNFGFASSFSFYVGHQMSTIEGGAICTDDRDLYIMLQMVRAHGWDRNLPKDIQKEIRVKHNMDRTFYSDFAFYELGYNLRATELQAFIGNVQLEYLPEIIKKREENFFTFSDEIYFEEDYYYPMRYNHIDTISNFAVPVICRSKEIHDMIIEKCRNIVEIRPIVGGDMTKQIFYRKYVGNNKSMSNASLIHEQGLYFGNNPELTDKEIKTILKVFIKEEGGI